jgi:hypothetical protein
MLPRRTASVLGSARGRVDTLQDAATLGELPPEALEARLQPLREILFALGMPAFPALVELVDPATLAAYTQAALDGVRVALLVPGVAAIVTGLLVIPALGPRDPVRSVFEYRDERVAADAV